ncbi:MAG TPA: ABC transporter permease [Acidimicrobiales bacterium]|nr:ABC transporter permease [Acidimicrobiales bacterium]
MSDARIVDRGYRRYEGERGGTAVAIRSLVRHSVQRALGLRRTPWSKVLPVLSVAIAYLPAIAFVGMAAFLPTQLVAEGILPDYGEYYGFITSAIVVFTAFVAPELLCTDRRTRMLGIYLASPLDRTTYLAAKAIAVGLVLSLVTLGPPLLMLIAFTFEGAGPGGVVDWLVLFGRIVLSGVVIAAIHAALSLAAASLTDRKAVASAGVILVLLLSSAVTGALVDGAGAPVELELFNLLGIPFELVSRIYPDTPDVRPELSTGLLAAANLGWTLLFTAVLVIRYRRLEVTR